MVSAVAEQTRATPRSEVVADRDPEEAAAPKIDLLLRTDGCPICAGVSDGTFDFLAHWQYLLATDEAAQQSHRAAGGYCREHTWALYAPASSRGISAAYPLIADRYAQEVTNVTGLPARVMAERLREVTPSAATCRLCAFQRQREEAAVRGLVTLLETKSGRAEYGATHGLCLPHLAAVLALGVQDETAALLVDAAARHLSDVSAAMRGYVLKLDARRRDLLTREEDNASHHALALLVGGRSRVPAS